MLRTTKVLHFQTPVSRPNDKSGNDYDMISHGSPKRVTVENTNRVIWRDFFFVHQKIWDSSTGSFTFIAVATLVEELPSYLGWSKNWVYGLHAGKLDQYHQRIIGSIQSTGRHKPSHFNSKYEGEGYGKFLIDGAPGIAKDKYIVQYFS